MKKFKSFFLVAIFCLTACCCLFTGCNYTGTYKFNTLKYDDGETSMTIRAGDKFQGMEIKEDSFILILDDENFIFRTNFTEANDNADNQQEETFTEVTVGTWIEGYEEEIYLKVEDDDVIVAKKDGKNITFDYDGVELTLTK